MTLSGRNRLEMQNPDSISRLRSTLAIALDLLDATLDRLEREDLDTTTERELLAELWWDTQTVTSEKERKEKSVRKKREKKKNWIYLESISYLNSDWNLFCALFSKTGVSSSYEVRFGSVSTQIEASDEPHLNSCRS